jgi:hypothetical protein
MLLQKAVGYAVYQLTARSLSIKDIITRICLVTISTFEVFDYFICTMDLSFHIVLLYVSKMLSVTPRNVIHV